jgi:hypothetical protein
VGLGEAGQMDIDDIDVLYLGCGVISVRGRDKLEGKQMKSASNCLAKPTKASKLPSLHPSHVIFSHFPESQEGRSSQVSALCENIAHLERNKNAEFVHNAAVAIDFGKRPVSRRRSSLSDKILIFRRTFCLKV